MSRNKTRFAHLCVFGALIHALVFAIHTIMIGPMFKHSLPDAIAATVQTIVAGPPLLVIWPFRGLYLDMGLLESHNILAYPTLVGFIVAYAIFIVTVLILDGIYMLMKPEPKIGRKKKKVKKTGP